MRLAKIKSGSCKTKRKDGGRVGGNAPGRRMDRPCRADGGGVQDYMRQGKNFSTGMAAYHAALAAPMGTIAVADPDPISKGLAGAAALAGGIGTANALRDRARYKRGEEMWGKTGMPDAPPVSERNVVLNRSQSGGSPARSDAQTKLATETAKDPGKRAAAHKANRTVLRGTRRVQEAVRKKKGSP